LENSSNVYVGEIKQTLEVEEAWPVVLEAIGEKYPGAGALESMSIQASLVEEATESMNDEYKDEAKADMIRIILGILDVDMAEEVYPSSEDS
jgi:hypothetical protein